jgi:hypothetical protein
MQTSTGEGTIYSLSELIVFHWVSAKLRQSLEHDGSVQGIVSELVRFSASHVRPALTRSRKDAILETFQLGRLEIQPRYTEDKDFISITVLKPPCKEHEREALGFIRYAKLPGEVMLVNACAQAQPNALQLAKSLKQNKDNLAGCHGEGLKLAAIDISRNVYNISLASSSCSWSFSLRGSLSYQLYCFLTPSKVGSQLDQTDSVQDMARFTPRIWRDVSVSMDQGPRVRPGGFD